MMRALGVQPPHQHRLVLDRHPVVHQQLAGPARLGGDLLGVVEVRHDEERRVAAQQLRQGLGDAHRQGHRHARPDADHLHVGDRPQRREELLEPLVREQQRVAAADQHVAHLGVGGDVVEPLLQGGAGQLGLSALRDAPPRAVAAVDRAGVGGQEEHPVGVLVHDGLHRAVGVFAEWVGQFAGPHPRLGPSRGSTACAPGTAGAKGRSSSGSTARRPPGTAWPSRRGPRARRRSAAPPSPGPCRHAPRGAAATSSRTTARRSPRGRARADAPPGRPAAPPQAPLRAARRVARNSRAGLTAPAGPRGSDLQAWTEWLSCVPLRACSRQYCWPASGRSKTGS